MARRLRIQYENALYHVINRGNYRSNVFSSVGTVRGFQSAIGEACERHGWRLHAYVVMRNHYHLALETPQPNLVEGMHWLQSTFATRFNRFRSENGHLFQGRYRALLVEDEPTLCRVIDYIHLNPVRAGIVPALGVAEFAASSLSKFLRGALPTWLVSEVVRRHGYFEDTPAGWSAYVRHLAALAADPEQQTREQLDQFSRGWAIGTLGWKRALAREYSHRALHPGLPAEESRELKESGWQEKLEVVLAEFGKTTADLNGDPPNAAWKIQLALRLRSHAVPYHWLTREMNLGAVGTLRVRMWRQTRL